MGETAEKWIEASTLGTCLSKALGHSLSLERHEDR